MRKQLLVAGFAVLILSVDLAAEEPSPVAASSQSRPDTTKQQPGRSNMDSQIRRVVTGKDQDGKAVAILDGPAPNVVVSKERGTTSTLLWVTDSTPADISGTTDATNRKIGVHPPANGTVFRIVEFPPENDVRSDYDTIRKAVRNQGLEPAITRGIPACIGRGRLITRSLFPVRLTCIWTTPKST